MPILTYAGIGARATPSSVLADMTVIAGWLARNGWHLATGGAEGADSAFAAGAPADRRSLWLPWPGYNGHHGPDCLALSRSELSACMDIAARSHPAWTVAPGPSANCMRATSQSCSARNAIGRSMRRFVGARAA